MKLTSKTDLEVPVSFVYATLADHPAWEREAVRRGAQVERPAGSPGSGVGASWRVRGRFRGKERKVLLRLTQVAINEMMAYSLDSPSVEGNAQFEVLALSPRRTRLRVMLDVRPKTLAARLFLNTLRLTRRRVEARFDKRTAQLAQRIAEAYQRSLAKA
ncbi:SRPBCC family protein [Tabrizicola aquatica]|uniref:SRPBCC family protein n=1 Tax=Tabrizicola aquatica TaxID=909926 RepID=UPI000CD2BF39|nr:SRPBCC family protein [Tabrizicola aquatica]